MTPARRRAFAAEITTKRGLITRLETELETQTTPVARELYHERIEQLRMRADLLEHTLALHEAYERGEENVHQLEQAFAILHNKLYPPLHPDLIRGTLNRKKTLRKIEALKRNHPEFYTRVLDRLEPYLHPAHDSQPTSASREAYTEFWSLVETVCAPYLQGVVFPRGLSTYQNTKLIFAKVLQNIASHHGTEQVWHLRKQRARTTFSVNHDLKTIFIPAKARPGLEIKGLVYHELFVHLVRGLQSELHNLLTPLPHYRAFEEGLGKTLQQLSQDRETITTEYYTQPLIITLGSIGLTFEEIKEFLFLTKNPGAKRHLDRARRRTIQRRFMLDEIDYNVLHYKDLSYGVGGLLLRLLCETYHTTETTDPLHSALTKVFERILTAKFDPTNSAHITYLEELGALPLTPEESRAYHQYLTTYDLRSVSRTIPKML